MQDGEQASPTRVLVAGAGLGGLTLAHALHSLQIEVRVLERAAGLSEIGAGITLWRNALCVLEFLGLGPALKAIAHEPRGGGIGSSDGRMLANLALEDVPDDLPRPLLLTFHRRDLQRVLLESLPKDCVEFGRELVGFEESSGQVRSKTRDGGRYRSELLVGADGIGSNVRRALLGAEPPRYAGYTCFRGVVDSWPGLDPQGGEFWGSGDRFGVVPIGGNRLYWFAVLDAPARREVPAAKPFLLERFRNYAWHVPEIIEHTPADAIVHNDIIDRPPVPRWSSSRVTLLGDAAHATTPNLGQGAAMAIESALILARALDETEEIPRALAGYEKARHKRTARVTKRSWRVGRIAHADSRPTRTLRNLLIRLTPAGFRMRSLVELIKYDATKIALVK